VVAAITPWNSPLMIACWKLAPALAAGCTVVLKPREDAPLTTLVLADLSRRRLPRRRLNVVTGLGETPRGASSAIPGIDRSASRLARGGGRSRSRRPRQLRPVTLEMGGKSPQVILADADMRRRSPAPRGAVRQPGRICAAGTRILVAREHYDDVVDASPSGRRGAARRPTRRRGDDGALINSAQATASAAYIDAGREEGARLVAAAAAPTGPATSSNPPCSPTRNTMKIAVRRSSARSAW